MFVNGLVGTTFLQNAHRDCIYTLCSNLRQWFNSSQCSKPLLVDDYMGLYYPIYIYVMYIISYLIYVLYHIYILCILYSIYYIFCTIYYILYQTYCILNMKY